MPIESDPSKDLKEVYLNPKTAITLPLGAASPLWLMFAGAASAGVAYWWLNRWRTATHLEAVLAPSLAAPEPELIMPEVVPPVVVEAFEAAAEAAEAPVIEAAPEAAPEAVVEVSPEAVVEAVAEAEPEATPDTLIEVAPTPKPAPRPKSKAAAVRAAPRTTSGPTRRA